jgi:hypothetical protein
MALGLDCHTTRFNIKKLYVPPTQCIYVFVRNSQQTVIISLYSINFLYPRRIVFTARYELNLYIYTYVCVCVCVCVYLLIVLYQRLNGAVLHSVFC